jgi:hypothetical protein
MVVRAATPMEEYAERFATIAGITEEIKDPVKQK